MALMFFCADCGYETSKWSGKCPNCGSWDTLKESNKITGKSTKTQRENQNNPPIKLKEIKDEPLIRLETGITEFDTVIGGGIIPGMVVLIGGEPGVGKSTLMLQLSNWLGNLDKKVVYFSGEESAGQINLRSQRLDVTSENIWLSCTNDADYVLDTVNQLDLDAVVIDSIQAFSFNNSDSIPGSISQVRECCSQFVRMAKKRNVPFFLIGHVTKDGMVAGPKIIEHMVDTVLYFEGETTGQYKILRAVKNRFGSTNELGLFEMSAQGLQEVKNPAQIFLSANPHQSGSAIGSMLEGSRAFTVEVQALAGSSSFGTPQRVGVGIEQKKLALLLAILEKNLSLYFRSNDVFVYFSGGIRCNDPALDLSILAAILSSLKDTAIPDKTIFIGEVSLSGEIRAVAQLDKRVKEAKRLGYVNIFVSSHAKVSKEAKLKPVNHIREVYRLFNLK